MRRTFSWLWLAVGVSGLAAGCGGLSGMDVAQVAVKVAPKMVQASRTINDQEEYYVGRAVAARVLAVHPLLENPKLTLYVNEVGATVARKSTRPDTYRGYHFAVLETTDINAFACPGGTIFITRGMLELCQSEDELAAVLAHEVGHVARKDGINSIQQARWSEVLTAIGTETAKQKGGAAGQLATLFEGSIDDVFKTIVVNGYGRAAEEAADAQAVETLRRAGYDPHALAAVLSRMTAKGGGGIFKTHPPTSQRLASVEAKMGGAAKPKGVEARVERFKSQKL